MALTAGFARVDITPPVGSEMPGGFFKSLATGVHDPLYVRAAWLDDGQTPLAVVSVDCVFFGADCCGRARRLARTRLDREVAVLMAATHTHSGGPTGDVLMSEADPAYLHWVAGQAATAIVLAADRAQPCSLRVGIGKAPGVAFNRRFRMSDGSVRTNPGFQTPEMVQAVGPGDPAVAAIGAYRGDQLLGAIVNFTCHSTFMGGTAYSGDYAAQIEEAAGAPAVFLPGAIGDINQCDFVAGRREDCFGEAAARRAGQAVGGAALEALASASPEGAPILAARSALVDLPLRGPSPEQVAQARRRWEGRDRLTVPDVYAREHLLLAQSVACADTAACELQAVRIGDMRIAATSVQPFCQIGLDVKSGFAPAMFAGLANGHLGYVGYRYHYTEGGYELDLKRTSSLAPGSGEVIVESLRALVSGL